MTTEQYIFPHLFIYLIIPPSPQTSLMQIYTPSTLLDSFSHRTICSLFILPIYNLGRGGFNDILKITQKLIKSKLISFLLHTHYYVSLFWVCFIISLSNSVLWRCCCSIITNWKIWQHSLKQHLLSEIQKMSYHLQKYYQLHYFSHFKLSIQNLQQEANYRLLQNELLLLYIVFMQTACTCHHKLKTYLRLQKLEKFF